jgi:hypothetical protein
MKKTLSEKQIVNHIVQNWDKFFAEENIKFQRIEWQALENYRADIMAYMDLDLKEIGWREKSVKYRATIILECKYQSESRDLIYELEKAKYLQWYLKERLTESWPVFIGVISDDFSDKAIYDYLIENDIHMWKINIKDNDIETMTLRYLTPGEHTQDDILERL